MRVILVPIADRPECAAALAASLELASKMGSDIVGCHIRPHSYSKARLPRGLRVLAEVGEADWDEAMKKRDPDRMSRDARSLFGRITAEAGLPLARKARADQSPVAIWQERVGSPQKIMPIVGPVSDLVVVSRPSPRGGRIAKVFLMQALLNSARPVLILPQRGMQRVASRVAIAWNQTPEAAHAVSAALPILRQADQVTVLVAGSEVGLGPKSSQLVGYLKHHGVHSEVVRTRGRDETGELMQGYRDARANLMVMGAYSRHRLREYIFGGFTDYMLREANIPVVMFHA